MDNGASDYPKQKYTYFKTKSGYGDTVVYVHIGGWTTLMAPEVTGMLTIQNILITTSKGLPR